MSCLLTFTSLFSTTRKISHCIALVNVVLCAAFLESGSLTGAHVERKVFLVRFMRLSSASDALKVHYTKLSAAVPRNYKVFQGKSGFVLDSAQKSQKRSSRTKMSDVELLSPTSPHRWAKIFQSGCHSWLLRVAGIILFDWNDSDFRKKKKEFQKIVVNL